MLLHTDRPGQRKRRLQRGSILVTCMVLAALGTIGVAAWISLLDARGHQVEQNLTALQRRAVDNNSRALARLAFYQNHLHDSKGVDADVTYQIPGNLGEAIVRSYASVPLQSQSSLRYAKNGVVPMRGFTTDVQVDLSDGIGTHNWQYQLKNYNPILGGDLLVMNPPADPEDPLPLVSGNLNVKGRAVFWDAVVRDYTAGLRADEIQIPAGAGSTTSFLDTGGNATAPLNYPRPRQTTGFAGAADPTYGGLDIINSVTNSHNAYASRIQALGPYVQVDGGNAFSVGPGPDTRNDNPNDDTLEAAVQTQTTDYLMTELPNYYPLSSRMLESVAAKTAPSAFTEDQIYTIFENHIPVPDDALTALMGAYRARMPTRTDEFHRANGTAASCDGNGVVRVFLESTELPHLELENTQDLRLFGQQDSTDASLAAVLEPRAIIVPNTGGNVLADVTCDEQNRRGLILAIATESAAASFTTNFTFTGSLAFPDWRMILELQNTGVAVDTSAVAGVTMTGGIRANRPVRITNGTFTLEREYEHDELENLLGRSAWIEAYHQ